MRFALVVEPSRADAVDRLAPLRAAVMRAGFNVVRLRADGALAKNLARAIEATDVDDAALVYVAGDVALDAGSIVLAGESRMSLADIATVVCGEPVPSKDGVKHRQLLFVVDARCEGEKGDALNAAEHAEAIVRAMAPREHHAELLAAVESSPVNAPPTFALTRFFVQTLDDASALATDGTMHMSTAFDRMTAHPEFRPSMPSFVHQRGPTDFVVVAPTSERVSEPPPSRASAPPSSARANRRSILPLPAIEPILADAERAHAKGMWDEALDGYRKALMLLGDGSPTAMASLYANVAEVKLAQGKRREAEASFEKALGASPEHARSLGALARLALEAKEPARAAGYERRVARTIADEQKKIEALARVAERYVEAKDLPKATEVIEEARAIRPDEPALLAGLRAAYEGLRQWRKVADVIGAQADAAPLLHDKAQRRFEQADVLLGRLRDEEAGLAALESALDDDPMHERALAALVAVRTRRQDWRALERTYARLVDAYAAREDAQHAWEVCKKLGQLRRDKLLDGPGALEAFTAVTRLRPKDVETRAALAELLVAKGDREGAVVELETAARVEPTRAETHRRLFELHRKAGTTDRAWLAATALEELKAAHVDHTMLANQFRGDAPRPSATLDEEAWAKLRVPGSDPVIDAITRAIAPAAAAIKVAELRAGGRLVALEPQKRQAPESTATVVRAFDWASRVLGVAAPELYVGDEAVSGLTAVQAPSPSTRLGASMMSGRKIDELSFFVGRHLVYYRPEHYALVFYPTLAEMTALFLAAVKLARPELPVPTHAAHAAAKLRKDLAAHVTEAQKSALSAAVEKLDARGGKVDLAAWIRAVELTANRAGMLLAGDLAVALAAMRGESRAVSELTYDERRADLLAFSASRALADLRARLGMAARASLPPPPPSGRLPAG